jgi:hypothetical protein
MPADDLLANAADGYEAEALALMFEGLAVARARRILEWASAHAKAPPRGSPA